MARTPRIGIVGTGRVGASVAVSILHSGIARELLLCDAHTAVAEGEAMDLSHGASFLPSATVRRASIDEMLDADAVVIAAGRNGRPDESRLALLRDNVAVVRGIAQQFAAFRGVLVIVTNPVDVLTFEAAAASGLPHERVIGTGTMLDTARLHQIVGATLGLDARSVHAQIVGEHGDSEVPLWSSARAGGVALRRFAGWTAETETRIADQVRTAAYEIIKRKGATNHAIGLVTAGLLRTVLRGENRVLTVSRVQSGVDGFGDVAFSLPSVVGADGAIKVVAPELNAEEQSQLERSARVLREALAGVRSTAS